MIIFPVIHIVSINQCLEQAKIAFECGSSGVFVISMRGFDATALKGAQRIKQQYGDKKVGVNLLLTELTAAVENSLNAGLDMTWADKCGIHNNTVAPETRAVRDMLLKHPDHKFFGSIAFKYQPEEKFPVESAMSAKTLGFIPTTSGDSTGSPPSIEKLKPMFEAANLLAVASGITAENFKTLRPYMSHVLVSTGISYPDQSGFDPKQLTALMALE